MVVDQFIDELECGSELEKIVTVPTVVCSGGLEGKGILCICTSSSPHIDRQEN